MDKEMMDKINEILKAKGKRELSMDELDKVVGGSENYTAEEERETNELYLSLARTFGFDVAHAMFVAQTGYQTFLHNPVAGDTDEEKMSVVLSNYWGLHDWGNGYH